MQKPQEFESDSFTVKFSEVINQLVASGLPDKDALIGIMGEMRKDQKHTFLKQLGMPTNKTDEKLYLLLRSRTRSKEEKRYVWFTILRSLRSLFDGILPDETSISFLGRENELREQFGDWHYGFAIRFFPYQDSLVMDRANILWTELLSRSQNKKIPILEMNVTSKSDKSNELIKAERTKRVELQQIIDKLTSKNLALTNELKEANNRIREVSKGADQLNTLLGDAETRLLQETNMRKQVEEKLRLSQEQIRNIERESNTTMNQFISEVDELKEKLFSLNNRDNTAIRLLDMLKDDARELMGNTLQNNESFDLVSPRLQLTLSLIAELERYFCVNERKKVETIEIPIPDSLGDLVTHTDVVEPLDEAEGQNPIDEEVQIGKFTRKTHGGIIEFEEGSAFITESVVTAAQIEHEAIVSYRKDPKSGKVNVSILMQGDDSKSPINQYLGFIQLGDHHQFYCVDVHTGDTYHLHSKDVEVLSVRNGDPCLFNVSDDNPFARISKLFKGDVQIDELQKKRNQESTTKKERQNEQSEKFLEGYKIVIVGGMQKWFASTVESTGATLIHETGYNHPQRIANDIKKADALFLILTANSHRATWGAVEVAKQYNVPYFSIQGGRSNLLSLLWENRAQIKKEMELST